MSDTAVSLLTASGTGAIATVCIQGSRAWELARTLFTPNGKPLPESPEINRFWFGTLGQDEVILAVLAPDTLEVHCHGGQRVVRWVLQQFLARGCVEVREPHSPESGWQLLQRAPTLRTANILLDQLNGAFTRETEQLLALVDRDPEAANAPLQALANRGDSGGRFLVQPRRVVVVGAPNVGKSSLVNALAGFERAVVSAVAGTTRDVVSVRTAFNGWPIELIDTAGLRTATGLEAEGIELAHEALRTANTLLWVMDSTAPGTATPELAAELQQHDEPIVVLNKSDLSPSAATDALPGEAASARTIRVSAKTGDGIAELARAVVAGMPHLQPGDAVPFTPRIVELVNAAAATLQLRENAIAARFLRTAIDVAQGEMSEFRAS